MIRVLTRNQVWDRQRLCFYVGLKRTKRKHQGLPVYTDAFGVSFVIKD
jgi:hypothetical protein